MSNKSNQPQLYPSAPPSDADSYHRGPPPPSYEDSLRMPGVQPSPQPYNAFPCGQLQQQQQHQQHPNNFPSHSQPPINHAAPQAPLYGYANPYQAHVLQQQIYYNTAAVAPGNMSPAHNVLHFDKRAEIRTNAAGAITVPPPPPGCAPTPGQLAAMTGNPVMVKKERSGFFF